MKWGQRRSHAAAGESGRGLLLLDQVTQAARRRARRVWRSVRPGFLPFLALTTVLPSVVAALPPATPALAAA